MEETQHKKKHEQAFSLLLAAMADIQEWAVMEKKQSEIDSVVFHIKKQMGFAKLAMRSAFLDTILWLAFYVVAGSIILFFQENYLAERYTQFLAWKIPGSPLYLTSKFSSFASLAFSTGVCVAISRYYVGAVTKKAIRTLFVTRGMFLIAFSLMGFFIFGILYQVIMSDYFVQNIYDIFKTLNSSFASRVYEFIIYQFRRVVFEAGVIALLIGFISTLLPFFTIVFFKVTRKKDEKAQQVPE